LTSFATRRGRRIVLLCEGDTEELAVNQFLRRQLAEESLQATGLQAINLNGKVQDASVKAALYLDDPNVIAVFTLIDLYGMDRVNHHHSDSLDQKVTRVRDWLRSGLSSKRLADFFPHVAVHETESWFLADGQALAQRLGDQGIGPDPQAELKNFQRPPSKKVNELFLSRKSDRYQKIRDGRPLFAAIQFERVYKACPYFRVFFDDLRSVARR
jgi:hypothetical protein